LRDYVAASLIGMIGDRHVRVPGLAPTDVAQLASGRARAAQCWWLKAIGFVATVAVTIW
jgi:hypothetical protein